MSDRPEPVSKLEAVRLALEELGDAWNEELSAFVEVRFGLKIPPPFIPVVRASLREQEHLEKARAAARVAAEQAAAKPVGQETGKPRSDPGS